ncbi:conjugal transfer protein TrbF [Rickettsiales bacterium Ac37b]|nr:conjugal transfer protein TrbF [Rickettsiales bacterium Ac37b]
MNTDNTDNHEPNPYVEARREWVERYGDYIVQAKNWRISTLVVSSIAVILAISITKNKIIPYIVQVDKLGKIEAVEQALAYKTPDHKIIKSELASFIEKARSISADNIVQKKALEKIYAYLPKGKSASLFVQEYINHHNPFELARNVTQAVEISSILQVSDKSWQIEWQELTRDLHGNLISSSKWKAALSIEFSAPNQEEDILMNPLGLFITELSWTKQL